MKKLMVAVAAVAMAMGAMAEGEANRFRVNVGGFGRMGIESRIDLKHYAPASESFHNYKKHQAEIYGGTIDLLANVMPGETFNLWTGLSLSYAPNQHLSNVSIEGYYKARFELETYDIRWMLIPEVNVCDSLALGLRLGVGLQGYKADLSLESEGYDMLKAKDINNFMPYALVGAQATWKFTENLGAFVACDFRFSKDASSGNDVRGVDGEFTILRLAKISGSSLDVTAGVSLSF